MDSRLRNRYFAIAVLILTLATGVASGATIGYFQTNLTSDIPIAPHIDPNLKNPWGMSFANASPFWVSDQVTNVSTLYDGAGALIPLVVATPPSAPPPTGPTGQVFAGGLGFTMNTGVSATFIFSTLAGTIDAWNGATSGTTASTQFTAPDGAIYTGLAQVGSVLYAADTRNGKIDVFNNAFARQAAVPGAFVDPNVAAGFTPYNVQNVGGKLYVEYAQRGVDGGSVGVFDAAGNLLQHIDDSHLNSPWGITLAPAGFGQFANDLLVGNFRGGMINAFDPVTGLFIGTLSDQAGSPILNDGLWALNFRSSTSGFNPNALFFTAGINNETNGLFGEIQVVPEPTTLSMLGVGAGLLALSLRRARRSN